MAVLTAEQTIREAWEPVSDSKAWEWIGEHVELPPDSELKNFDFELFPLARFVLDNLAHNLQLKRFTEMLSVQVGKTVTILAYLCWKIVNRPSSVGWYTDTGINAKHDYKTKILPALESCAKVAPLLPADRAKKNNTLIQFGFMNLRVMGAESKSNREGKTISEVMCDECRNYPPGAMQQIDGRYKTITNYRRIIFSSAGDITQEPWPSFKKGTRHMGFWPCAKCGHKQTFRFGLKDSPLYPEKRECGGFKWDNNDRTHPSDDVWNFKELDPTIRYECENPACRHLFSESDKIGLIRAAEFEQTNPMADPSDVSVHCWEAYMPFAGCSWATIVHKFLNAVVESRHGNIMPMRVFVTETLGEPWEERGEKPLEGEIMKRCGEYSIGEVWPETKHRADILVFDNQHGFVHYNWSQWTRLGEKRLIKRGQFLSFDELREFQKLQKIKDRGVGGDVSHKPQDVYRECLKYGQWIQGRDREGRPVPIWSGWLPLAGDEAEEFTQTREGVSFKTYWKAVVLDVNIGKPGQPKYIHRFSWSGPHYKNELYFQRIKGTGPVWEIPKNIEHDYIKQMQSVERREMRDAEGNLKGYEWHESGRHDDSDCEQMQLVMADINDIKS